MCRRCSWKGADPNANPRNGKAGIHRVQTDQSLRERIEELAAKNTEGNLTPEERDEYAGYVRANKFVAVLRREAKKFKSGSAA
jgi:hypothetical protein